jgi:F-type H+-transporting ATPase subunit delta
MALRRSGARRYAEAAFGLAERDGTMEQWLTAMRVAEERLGTPDVARILSSPAVPFPVRRDVVERILGEDVTGAPRNLVLLLVRRNRVGQLADVGRELRRLDDRRQGIVNAVVTSAMPLTDEEEASLRERLASLAEGGRVEVTTTVDPDILGGVQVRIGDRLIDGSVRGRLERLRHRIAAGSI